MPSQPLLKETEIETKIKSKDILVVIELPSSPVIVQALGEFKSSLEVVMKWIISLGIINPLSNLVRVAPDCNRSYCEDSFSGYSGSV